MRRCNSLLLASKAGLQVRVFFMFSSHPFCYLTTAYWFETISPKVSANWCPVAKVSLDVFLFGQQQFNLFLNVNIFGQRPPLHSLRLYTRPPWHKLPAWLQKAFVFSVSGSNRTDELMEKVYRRVEGGLHEQKLQSIWGRMIGNIYHCIKVREVKYKS